jgi:hypothetical protein
MTNFHFIQRCSTFTALIHTPKLRIWYVCVGGGGGWDKSGFIKKHKQMHLWLFRNHTYMFLSSSATIFRVYSVKEYNKMSVWRISSRSEFIKCCKILKLLTKWLKVVSVRRKICCCIGLVSFPCGSWICTHNHKRICFIKLALMQDMEHTTYLIFLPSSNCDLAYYSSLF